MGKNRRTRIRCRDSRWKSIRNRDKPRRILSVSLSFHRRGGDSWAELPERPSMALNRTIRRQSDFYFPRILIYTGRLSPRPWHGATEERKGGGRRAREEKREREIESCSFTRIRVRLRLPSRGVALRVISPLRVGRHMAGRLRGTQRQRTVGGPAHNFQIYVQMFLAKRPTGRFFLSLFLSISFSRFFVSGEDIYRKVSRN